VRTRRRSHSLLPAALAAGLLAAAFLWLRTRLTPWTTLQGHPTQTFCRTSWSLEECGWPQQQLPVANDAVVAEDWPHPPVKLVTVADPLERASPAVPSACP
jgi:hypothetical protein